MLRVAVAVALGAMIGPAAIGQSTSEGKAGQDQDKKKIDRLAKPWPDAEELRERQLAAESLPLFTTSEPLAFTLAADFKAVNKDRQVESTERFPGVLTVTGERGQPVAIPVQIGTRGRLRLSRRVCSFAPLRIEFPKEKVKGTVFERQGSLKLVTHCENSSEYEQYVLGEALAYRIGNVLTPASFRIRLARVIYLDSAQQKTLGTRWAILIEDEDDVARRMQARVAPLKQRLFRNLDQPSLLTLTAFQTLIGNTDYSIHALHNVRLIQDREGVLRPVAYDFDSSGLVSTPYAAPDPKLHLQSVRDRRYRGPCLPIDQLEPTLAAFRARKAELLALCATQAGMTEKYRTAAKDYLEDFFDVLANQRRSRLLFVERCHPSQGM